MAGCMPTVLSSRISSASPAPHAMERSSPIASAMLRVTRFVMESSVNPVRVHRAVRERADHTPGVPRRGRLPPAVLPVPGRDDVVVDRGRMTLRLGLVAGGAIGAPLAGRPAAAEQEYVIGRGTAVGGFEWQPSSGNYASRQACEEGIEGRKRRVAGVVAFLRRIGVYGTPAPAGGTAQSPGPDGRGPAFDRSARGA